jgi:predicted DNA-binding protein
MSITPRTFISRTFNAGILNQDPNKQTDLDDYWFVDEYRNQQGAPVMRFGIDRNSIIAKYDKDQDAYLLLEEKIKVTQKDDNVSSNTSKKSTQYLPNIVIHHTLEKFLLAKAIDYLRAGSNQTVLLHIFERTDGEINLDDSRSPKTHTVLLYNNSPESSKVGKIQVVVIDPTNFTFSSHLRDLNADANFKDVEIITFHGKAQIYKKHDPQASLGNQPENYRDCADIAVKIAFLLEINKQDIEKLLKINREKIVDKDLTSVPLIKMLSNNTKIDSDILSEKASIRVKQASDVETIRKFYEAQKWLQALHKMLSEISDKYDVREKVLDTIKLIAYSPEDTPEYENFLRELSIVHSTIIDNVKVDFNEILGVTHQHNDE